MAEARPLGAAAGAVLALALLLAGCASGPRSGRDGAPSQPPSDVSSLPDAQPRVETIRASGSTANPYTVLGRSYVPITDDRPFRETGLASWYGTKFHAQSTASGEPYDMYAMTAAHKTLPLPSYVRVRNPANGREAIVRVNDRGPFAEGRIIDLSYAAAARLDLLRGVAPVEIERITNEDIRAGTWRRDGDAGTAVASALPLPSAAPAAGSVAVPAAMVAPVALNPAQGEVAGAAFTSPVAPVPQREVATLAPLPALSPSPMPRPAPAPQAGADAPGAGFWVQLGAFSQSAGASGLRERAARGVPAMAPQLTVFSENGLYRVQAGPFASREAARDAADQLRAGLQLSPMVLERR